MTETMARVMPFKEWLEWRRLMESRPIGANLQKTIDRHSELQMSARGGLQ